MGGFAFMIHPIDPRRDVQRKFPLLGRLLPEPAIHFFSAYFPPVYLSHITGIRSAATGKEIEGWLVACPLTPQRMLSLPLERVYRKIIETGRLAERLGARILGLGAFTAVVGDAGVTVAKHLHIPVTTGNSYTVAVALQALREAARRVGIPLEEATAAVVGATGAIGRVAARLLAREVPRVILAGRRAERLESIRPLVEAEGARAEIAKDLEALREADLVLVVSSSPVAIIGPEHLKPGAVVCDVAQPRNVSPTVAAQRGDVLVIDGGIVEVPGEVDFGFDFGLPPRMAYACMAETIALALEGRWESYSLGRRLSIEQVEEITRLAEKHGFRLAGFLSFGRPVSEADLQRIRARVPFPTGHIRG
ncbi:Aminotransferase PigE [Candidatus Thermoflexus japonica]|uniref:Aminotransferase PigE n=1 Tax=Candidatus Thermoflexus japonica TaxID=2035417 RepID=A0A2H5Y318_9CHLR|nr:Aminotransferase PigE [Candidatus Thermoflexus japonica]